MLKNKRIYIIPVLGFLILILFTSFLLVLPISSSKNVDWFNALFISTSAVSTTGFTTLNIAENFTILGQFFLIVSTQIGSLGFMIFFAFILSIRNKKIKLSDTLILSNEINFNNHSKVKERAFKIIKYTLLIDFFGAMLLAIAFIPEYGVLKGLWYGIFHSISAFCNAGFDLLGNSSLIKYKSDLYFNIVTIGIMLCGGLGYFVLEDIVRCIKEKNKHLQVHSKLIISTSIWLIIISTILLKLVSPSMTLLQAFFNTITSRSTGFSTMDFTLLNNSSKIILILLMFIGGASGSNAGGIRLTNFAILTLLPITVIKNEELIVFYRKIDYQIIKKSMTMIFTYIFLVIIGLILLTSISNINSIDLLFELVSSFTTTGLGTFDINELGIVEKWILMFYMYIGRLGPITFFTLFSFNNKKNNNMTYANADLML